MVTYIRSKIPFVLYFHRRAKNNSLRGAYHVNPAFNTSEQICGE